MTAIQKEAEEMGKRIGVDPASLLIILTALFQLSSVCLGSEQTEESLHEYIHTKNPICRKARRRRVSAQIGRIARREKIKLGKVEAAKVRDAVYAVNPLTLKVVFLETAQNYSLTSGSSQVERNID